MASRRSLIRRTAALTAAATATVILAACGSSDSSSSSSSGHSGHDMGAMSSARPSAAASAAKGGKNAQDVSFAQKMIPHHRQAVSMAGLAPSRAKSQQVKDLAEKIEQAQAPEINTMSGWLRTWGAKVPGTGMSGMENMPGMAHSDSSMSGMMSDADMAELKGLSGAAFDRAFLQMMIRHHQGAIEMAKAEQAKGAYGPARTMAKSIVTSQSAEIAEMNAMLGK
ncbi:DUF305 domain-containing protein [Streptomyces tropicalis]|uniref:DUF305 domain-containing protein n=1 Tax=Streptomyces tropicalis TaxID=3034234 RepID=A0ABT6A8B6_9ACTN|nr:DUF305 domain-containing protein [Streptomyces tropicalis]MDF3300881.1 DUF305 domain-containing protein [Streptomyces tropicalis]